MLTNRNIVFVLLFFLLDICFFLFAAAFFKNGDGASPKLVSNLFVAAGAFLFGTPLFGFVVETGQLLTNTVAVCICGWWLLVSPLAGDQ
jgi:uncharacterized protein